MKSKKKKEKKKRWVVCSFSSAAAGAVKASRRIRLFFNVETRFYLLDLVHGGHSKAISGLPTHYVLSFLLVLAICDLYMETSVQRG